MGNIAVYVRQSQDKAGNHAAVERQESACRLLAEAKGWDELRFYRDNDISATSGKPRPEFERLIKDIDAGRVEALLVWHLDRLTRSIKDLTRVIEAGRARRVNIASVHGVSIDLSDPTGVAVATILTAIAAMEVGHKSARQKAANQQRAKAGKAHWVKRPYGYDRDGTAAYIVPEEAENLKDAARRVLDGATLASIVRDWNTKGMVSTEGKPWNVTSLRRSLINPRTAGQRLYNGEELRNEDGDKVMGEWEAIFTPELHQELENKLNDPRRRTAPDDMNSKHLLSGICVCGKCGKKMFASPVKAKGRQYMVYRCFGGYCMTRRLDLVDEVVEGVVVSVLSKVDAASLFSSGEDTAALRRKAVDLRERRDQLGALLAEGLLSAANVRNQAGRLTAELAAIEGSLESAGSLNPALSVIGAEDVAAEWRALPLAHKRQIIRTLMSVTVLPAGKGVRFSRDQVRIEEN